MIIFVTAATLLTCWLAYRLDLWKTLYMASEERFEMALAQVKESQTARIQAEDKTDSMQRFLNSISTRPIYAVLTTEQIELIGKLIVAGAAKKEYVN